MRTVDSSRLQQDPLCPGRWWLRLPHDELPADWIDLLAREARQRWPGKVAVLDAAATLISNLRVWENIVLPRWQHENLRLDEYEDQVAQICDLAGLSEARREKLAARLPAMLDKSERRLAVLMRSVLLGPDCVIVEDEFLREMHERGGDAPHVRLWSVLQNVPCLLVCGHSAAQTGFSALDIKDREGGS